MRIPFAGSLLFICTLYLTADWPQAYPWTGVTLAPQPLAGCTPYTSTPPTSNSALTRGIFTPIHLLHTKHNAQSSHRHNTLSPSSLSQPCKISAKCDL